jgi:predicted N-acetyltransferase YhbS
MYDSLKGRQSMKNKQNSNDTESSLSVRPCAVSEYPALLAFLDKAFDKKESRWFAKNLGNIFNTHPQSIRNHHIAWLNGVMAGVIGIYPLTLKIGSAKLLAGGIGSVSTDSALRGKGIMSALLTYAIETMDKAGYDVSWLCGDRFRYGNYGWETGGARIVYTLKGYDIERWWPQRMSCTQRKATLADVSLLKKSYNSFRTGIVRSDDMWRIHLKRLAMQFMIGQKASLTAYLAYNKEKPDHIIEIQGSFELMPSIILAHMKRFSLKTISVVHPKESDAVAQFLCDACCDYHITHNKSMRPVNIDSLWPKIIKEIVKSQKGSGLLEKDFNSLKYEEDKIQIIYRALGFFDDIPALTGVLKKFNVVRPLHWYLGDVDGV